MPSAKAIVLSLAAHATPKRRCGAVSVAECSSTALAAMRAMPYPRPHIQTIGGEPREPQAAPDRDELPAVLHLGRVAADDRRATGSRTKHWSGTGFGAIFSTMGIASLFMPSLDRHHRRQVDQRRKTLRPAADRRRDRAVHACRWSTIRTPMFWVMLLNMIFYMPTIALAITVAYNALKNEGWTSCATIRRSACGARSVSSSRCGRSACCSWRTSPGQFYVASVASLLLGLYAFTLPKCPPRMTRSESRSLLDALGLTSFRLFREPQHGGVLVLRHAARRRAATDQCLR